MAQDLKIEILVDAVARKAGLSRATATKAVEAMFEAVPEALAESSSEAHNREFVWSDEFLTELLGAFRRAVAIELDEHRAASRFPPVIPRN